MSETDRFDALLMNVAQTQRGIEPLLDTVFSFLRRKTDFFSGASAETIESTVLKCVRKQAQLVDDAQQRKRQEEEQKRKKLAAEQKRKAAEKAAAEKAAAEKTARETPRFEEITDDDNSENAPANAAEDKVAAPVAPPAVIKDDKQKNGDDSNDDDDEDSGPPPVGNGGVTDKYVWTQTLQEAQASFPVPEGTKSRQVDVVITATKLKVALKGGPTLADGPLFKKIKVDDSFWTLEDGNRICVYLQKDNQMEWWRTIIEGDAEIDTKKVQPENSKLGDLDSDTRQTVEKMMFDQRQKALGLPSSDDLQKQSVLQKFMAQHPEMDFSNAKFN